MCMMQSISQIIEKQNFWPVECLYYAAKIGYEYSLHDFLDTLSSIKAKRVATVFYRSYVSSQMRK